MTISRYEKKYTTPSDTAAGEREREFEEKVVSINRVSRTVKGGTRIRFRVLVVVGNKKGKVGYGIGKSGEIVSSIKKAVAIAKRSLINVSIVNGTIPYPIDYQDGAVHIKLLPAKPGTSIIAGGAVRAVVELAGIKNILSKVIGTNNQVSNVKGTIDALKRISNKITEKNDSI